MRAIAYPIEPVSRRRFDLLWLLSPSREDVLTIFLAIGPVLRRRFDHFWKILLKLVCPVVRRAMQK